MKKYMGVLLCLCLIFALSAAALGDEPVSFTLKGGSGGVGQTVTVDIDISANSGITNMLLTLSYNPEQLRYKDYSAGEALSGGLYEFNPNLEGRMKLAFITSAPVTAGGTVLSLSFEILKTEDEAASSVLSLTVDEAMSESEAVEYTVIDGQILIDRQETLRRGDANGDGELNELDEQAVKNYILGASDLAAGFDLNGDGRCDIADYVILRRML